MGGVRPAHPGGTMGLVPPQQTPQTWASSQDQGMAGKVQAFEDPILRNPKGCRLESLGPVPNAHTDTHTNTPRGSRRTRTVGSFHSRFL